jgi:hypothetical protein
MRNYKLWIMLTALSFVLLITYCYYANYNAEISIDTIIRGILGFCTIIFLFMIFISRALPRKKSHTKKEMIKFASQVLIDRDIIEGGIEGIYKEMFENE